MTTQFVAIVLVLFLGILAADYLVFGFGVPVLLGRWILGMIEWIAVWR